MGEQAVSDGVVVGKRTVGYGFIFTYSNYCSTYHIYIYIRESLCSKKICSWFYTLPISARMATWFFVNAWRRNFAAPV